MGGPSKGGYVNPRADFFTMEYPEKRGGGSRLSALGWVLAVAFAIAAGVLARMLMTARFELAELRSQGYMPAEITVADASVPREGQAPGNIVIEAPLQGQAPREIVIQGTPSEAKQYAVMALLQAARVQELEKKNADLTRRLRGASAKRPTRENADLRGDLKKAKAEIKEWEKAGAQGVAEIEHLRGELGRYEKELNWARTVLAELGEGKRSVVPTEFRRRP